MAGKDTYYFQHDYNARVQKGMPALLMRHGMLGYGVYWSIKEMLFNNQNSIPADFEVLAYDLRVGVEVVTSVVSDFGLFTVVDAVISMDDVQEQLDERAAKTLKARDSINKRWENKRMEDAPKPARKPRQSKKNTPESDVPYGGNTNVLRQNYEANTGVLPPKYDTNTIKERKGEDSITLSDERVGAVRHSLPPGYTEQQQQDWDGFQQYLHNYAAKVLQMDQPFTPDQFFKMRADYSEKVIKDVLTSMHNRRGLCKEYVSANLTFRKWAQMRVNDPKMGMHSGGAPVVSPQMEELKQMVAKVNTTQA